MSELDDKNYCPTCGIRLTRTKFFRGYDVKTGREIYYTRVTCPNNKWYNRHFLREFDENGESIWSDWEC